MSFGTGAVKVDRGLAWLQAKQEGIYSNPASGNHPCMLPPVGTVTLTESLIDNDLQSAFQQECAMICSYWSLSKNLLWFTMYVQSLSKNLYQFTKHSSSGSAMYVWLARNEIVMEVKQMWQNPLGHLAGHISLLKERLLTTLSQV